MPNFTLFVGINGAGKTTLYKSLTYMYGNGFFGKRINMDEIVCEFNGDNTSIKDYAKAAKITVARINECINNRISFNWETTIISPSTIKIIKMAKEQGFKVNVYFIGVKNLNLAIERVHNRKMQGGHSVPEHLIEQRFNHQFDNITQLYELANTIHFYDNIPMPRIVAFYGNQKLTTFDQNLSWIEKITDTKTIEQN